MSKTYYGPNDSISNEYRLSPAPQVSINTQPYYSGDIIIGYTHTVSLRGYASSYRKLNNNEPDPTHSINSIGLVTDNIAIVKNILSRNGSNLSVIEEDGITTIKCKGGILRSLSFNQSPNNWVGYAEYTAEIEFNEIELLNGNSLKSIACSSSYLDNDSKSNNIVDISKYKIKEFKDSWSFNLDDNLFNRTYHNDVGIVQIDNSSMSVSYTISATGKNYYVDNNLIPAWQQAKNFVQDRLYNKVINMLTQTLGLTGDEACSAAQFLSAIGSSTNSKYSMLSDLNNIYQVYNETLSCNTSESDGTFSATYNAIVKKNNNTEFNHGSTRHTINKTINIQNDSRKVTTISIQGNIEGLVVGGIIKAAATGFIFPQNGSILISGATNNKYAQALAGLNKIILGSDLKQTLKDKLGITLTGLGLTGDKLANCNNATNSSIKPLSFNLTHNYHEGTINYSVEYSSVTVCSGMLGAFANISISSENPVPILVELPIPHSGVLLVQDINTYTAKKITINIEGKGTRHCCLTTNTLKNLIKDLGQGGISIPSGITLPDMNNYTLTQKQRTDNPVDGSYNISLGYTCNKACV
jgi:hypothetical protein